MTLGKMTKKKPAYLKPLEKSVLEKILKIEKNPKKWEKAQKEENLAKTVFGLSSGLMFSGV
jgi:hypothetical protein